MRLSHFWLLLEERFTPAYAATLARDHVISELGERTVQQALDAGLAPALVWRAICEDFQIPETERLGIDRPARPVPRHIAEN